MKKCLSLVVSLLVLFSLLAGALPAALAAGDEAIAFTDAALEAKVRAAMGKPDGPITMAEAEKVDYLNLNNDTKDGLDGSQLIRDISDLRYFVNLSKLDMINNDVSDISVLSGLQGLKYLDLGGNAIKDLTPLSTMALEELNIWDNDLTDVTPLAAIETLKRLSVNDNQISDFSPLSKLANLEALNVRMNASADYRALADIVPQLEVKDFEVLTTPYDPDEVVAFADKALEAHVRAFLKLGDEPITAGYAASITALDISNSWDNDVPEGERFSDISPLKYFVNLQALYLTRNAVHDISVLAELKSLTFLQMNDNEVLDFAPLAGLTGLTYLSLDSYGRDLSVISGLTELRELGIRGINALPQWLPALPKLKAFDGSGGELVDISLLAQCKQLTAVNLSWNLITDISPLVGLPLTELYLAGNPIADYTPIRDIYGKLGGKDFEYIELKQPDDPAKTITFADPVLEQKIRTAMDKPEGPITAADASQVTRLDIHNDWQPQIPTEVRVTNLQGLEAFLNLRELDAGFNDISDLSPLADLTELRKINLGGNRIQDLTPLARLMMLEDLTLFGSQISDISPLGGHTALRSLNLGGNPLADIGTLAELTNLDALYMGGSGIEDISPLAGDTNISRLELNDNYISDLAPLAGMTGLVKLKIANNPIKDYAPIEQIFPQLQEKDFELGQIFDVQVPLKPAKPDQEVPIADAALEAILRNVSGVQGRPLTEKDLSRVGKFEIKVENGQAVSDISALRYCLNLEGVAIWESNVSDLSPLSGLTRLRKLWVNHSLVSDVSPLKNITSLTELDLAWNQIADFSPLYGLQGLKVLRISHNLTSDASGFKDMAKGLKDKDFDPDQPMETAPNDAQGEQSDGSGQAGLLTPQDPAKVIKFADKVLEQRVREVIGKPEGPITAGDAAKVTELNIGNEWQEKFPKGSQISKLGGIEYLINLRSLDITFHKVKDLSKLSGLTQLTYLKAFGNVIKDVSPLAGLTSLTSLNVGGNNIKSVTALGALQNLTTLMLNPNPITDFSPVASVYPRLTEKDFELN